MKRFISILLCCLMLCSCSSANYKDVTPSLETIRSVCIQRTKISDKGEYTYFEKILSSEEDIKEFCKNLDKLKFVRIDPVEFNSADYLIIFEGKKDRKIILSGDEIIYDGLAYKIESGSLVDSVGEIYEGITLEESSADSRLFS